MNPLAHGFLQQKAADARAGVDGGEDEQGLEHDGEVIPVFEKIAQPMGGCPGASPMTLLMAWLRMWAMPTARATAPPVRPWICSPTSGSGSSSLAAGSRAAISRMLSGWQSGMRLRGRVDVVILRDRKAAMQAAIRATMPTRPSMSMRALAVADHAGIGLFIDSFWAWCPEATREWKPEMAPHMMVMKRKGKIAPGTTGPPPRNVPLIAGACRTGWATITPTISEGDGAAIFMKLER